MSMLLIFRLTKLFNTIKLAFAVHLLLVYSRLLNFNDGWLKLRTTEAFFCHA